MAGDSTAPGRQARAELLFELLQNNAVLSRSSQEDPALSVWNEAETEISDTGYLVLGAFWTENGAALMDVPAALRDIDALHRQFRRAHSMGQAGRHVLRRLGRARLDDVGPIRFHAGDVVGIQ